MKLIFIWHVFDFSSSVIQAYAKGEICSWPLEIIEKMQKKKKKVTPNFLSHILLTEALLCKCLFISGKCVKGAQFIEETF